MDFGYILFDLSCRAIQVIIKPMVDDCANRGGIDVVGCRYAILVANIIEKITFSGILQNEESQYAGVLPADILSFHRV